jgi:hypothetical protein
MPWGEWCREELRVLLGFLFLLAMSLAFALNADGFAPNISYFKPSRNTCHVHSATLRSSPSRHFAAANAQGGAPSFLITL